MREISGILISVIAFLGLAVFCVWSHLQQQPSAVPADRSSLEEPVSPPADVAPLSPATPPAALPAESLHRQTEEPSAALAPPSVEASRSPTQTQSQPEPLFSQAVTFSLDSDTISPQSRETVDALLPSLKEHPSSQIILIGHADNSGPEQYNVALSQRRAETVKLYLMRNGIAASRLTASGAGSSHPIADNSMPEGRRQNRRTELIVYPPRTAN